MSTGGRASRWRRGLFAALAAALVLGALLPMPGRRGGAQPRVDGIGVATAGETSPLRLAQRIRADRAKRSRPRRRRRRPSPPSPSPRSRSGQAGPGGRRPQERRLRDLPHQDRFAEHAHRDDGEARLHRLPRRQGRGPRARGRCRRAPRRYDAAKKQAHVLPRSQEVWRTSANPDALLHGAPPGERGVRAVRQPGRSAGGPPDVRPQRLPSDRGRRRSRRA